MIFRSRIIAAVDPLAEEEIEQALDLAEEEIEQAIDRALPRWEAYLEGLRVQAIYAGAPITCCSWNSIVEVCHPYNARNRRRWSDKLIPE